MLLLRGLLLRFHRLVVVRVENLFLELVHDLLVRIIKRFFFNARSIYLILKTDRVIIRYIQVISLVHIARNHILLLLDTGGLGVLLLDRFRILLFLLLIRRRRRL